MRRLKACFKDDQRLDTAVQALFGLMMMVVISACLFLSWILYARKQNTLPNILLLPAGLFAAYAIVWGVKRLMKAVRPERRKMLWIICSLAALALQMVMIHSYYFYTDWDVETIVESAMAAATGSDISRHSNYFSMCPNNLVLVTLLGWIVRFAYFLGLAEHAYFVMLVFLCVICWAAGILLCMLMHHLLHSDVMTAVAWIFYQLLVGISPWISIPYSSSSPKPSTKAGCWLKLNRNPPRPTPCSMPRWPASSSPSIPVCNKANLDSFTGFWAANFRRPEPADIFYI